MNYLDLIVEGGDIANREEIPIQNAATSWSQFTNCYLRGIKTVNRQNLPTRFFMVPGNHDASNAIGYYKPLYPKTDASSMAAIYNLMMRPPTKKTAENFEYSKDKINHSENIEGIHFMFLEIWPDSSNRLWMGEDLKFIPASTPVIIFTHDPPEGDPKHFTKQTSMLVNDSVVNFENLLDENFKDNNARSTALEQAGWCSFLKSHSNIKAYFHGHNNYNQYYKYNGINGNINLPVFRADSPMKGQTSRNDETKLSFQYITIDVKTKKMTVVEILWNDGKNLKRGDKISVSLN